MAKSKRKKREWDGWYAVVDGGDIICIKSDKVFAELQANYGDEVVRVKITEVR